MDGSLKKLLISSVNSKIIIFTNFCTAVCQVLEISTTNFFNLIALKILVSQKLSLFKFFSPLLDRKRK